ncbi:hypothetical protein TsFJ059_005841, partial [Trichoderma semiorbis]
KPLNPGLNSQLIPRCGVPELNPIPLLQTPIKNSKPIAIYILSIIVPALHQVS